MVPMDQTTHQSRNARSLSRYDGIPSGYRLKLPFLAHSRFVGVAVAMGQRIARLGSGLASIFAAWIPLI